MPHETELKNILAREHRANWSKSQRASWSKNNHKASKKKLVLVLPAHNEELIIQTTIKSAVVAGQKIEDIFVVDDFSSDKTRKMAVEQIRRSSGLIKYTLDDL